MLRILILLSYAFANIYIDEVNKKRKQFDVPVLKEDNKLNEAAKITLEGIINSAKNQVNKNKGIPDTVTKTDEQIKNEVVEKLTKAGATGFKAEVIKGVEKDKSNSALEKALNNKESFIRNRGFTKIGTAIASKGEKTLFVIIIGAESDNKSKGGSSKLISNAGNNNNASYSSLMEAGANPELTQGANGGN